MLDYDIAEQSRTMHLQTFNACVTNKTLYNIKHIPSPSQEYSLHSKVTAFMPLHSLPPQDGLGLLQILNFSLLPPPHGTEQLPMYQSDQPPSTTKGPFSLLVHSTYLTYAPGQH